MSTSFAFIEFLEVFALYARESPAWGRHYLRIAERLPSNTVALWRITQ